MHSLGTDLGTDLCTRARRRAEPVRRAARLARMNPNSPVAAPVVAKPRSAMGLVTLGRSALQVTPICLGTMTFGEQVDEPASHAILDHAVERGINFLDTAEMYAVPVRRETCGASERILGNWFAARPGVRNQVVLATKVEDNDQYGNLLLEKTVPWGIAFKPDNNFFSQRTLWSTRNRTPPWLLFVAYTIILIVWGTVIYLVMQLLKIKKMGKGHIPNPDA